MSKHHGPERIGSILRDWLETSGLGTRLNHLELCSVWEEVVGPAICRHSRVVGFARHKLYVDVDSSAHLQELRTFSKDQILRDIRHALPAVRVIDIIFRPAPVVRT